MRNTLGLALVALLSIPSASSAQEIGDSAAGFAYAKQSCAECHAILPAEPVSPVLDAPSFSEVANMAGMTDRALRVWLQSSHPTMPNLIVPPDDRDNVIAYILSLKEPRK